MNYKQLIEQAFAIQIMCEQIRSYTIGLLCMNTKFLTPEEVKVFHVYY